MLIVFRKYRVSLIAAIGLVIAGCASEPVDPQQEIKANMQVMRDAVIDTVKDKQRQRTLIDLTRLLEKSLAEYNRAYSNFASEFGKLNRKYDTSRAKLEELHDSFRETRKSAMNEVTRIHFEMVANTSEDEWKKIVKKEIEAIKSVRQLPEDQLGV